ncbi:MAG TPA: transcriptional regulator [Clostridiales bacterium]|nr:transcriptional regulator [Clostridiales bacterium]
MGAADDKQPINPYHYIRQCIGGKWKMTILHEIYTFGSIRFNYAVRVFPLSEKVLSQQLKELVEDGLVNRIAYDVAPPKVSYELTEAGKQLMPALDAMYIWAIRRMDALNMPIDPDAFVVHKSEKYMQALRDVMENYDVPEHEIRDYKPRG